MDGQRSGDGGKANRNRIDASLSYSAHTPEWMTIAAQGTSGQVQTEWLSEFDKPLRLLKSEGNDQTTGVKPHIPGKQDEISLDTRGKGKRRFRVRFSRILSSERTHTSWTAMHKRCGNRNDKDYPNYGGRGIRVCKRWSGPNGFYNFWRDMGERPDGMTLDRKDVNRGYTRANTKWSDRKEQRANRRDSKR